MSLSFFDRCSKKMVDFNANAFRAVYEECYYIQQKGERSYIAGVSINSRIAEKRADALLKDGISNSDDVGFILAWKIGGIDHKKSDALVIYKPEWENEETVVVSGRFKFQCDRDSFNHFCDKVVCIARDYQKSEAELKANTALKDLLDAVKSCNIKLGVVYILTVLYFITNGDSPIFDSCAYKAVKSIYNGVMPAEIWYENPSRKDFDSIILVINEYKWYLKQIFGTSNIPREYDRALWVYGHNKTIK